MHDGSPVTWPVGTLVAAYRNRSLSPVEVTRDALARIERADPQLNAYITVTDELALEQAAAAERAYGAGEQGPLLGVPISIKDAFHVRGFPTTIGSLVHAHDVSAEDSGLVARLRATGCVFLGKTNTAEFGQSATTDNRLRVDARNPWDPMRTPGGSSGGAAASVAAALASVAIGSDGGGSIRIPAAFTGLFGLKPTPGSCRDEGGFRAMSEFVSPGPLTWRAADARPVLDALRDDPLERLEPRPLRIGWCPRPEGRPVDPGVAAATAAAAACLVTLGHALVEVDLPLAGWDEAFGPLVLEEEWRERGHLLDTRADELSDYELQSLQQARDLSAEQISAGRDALTRYRRRIAALFDDYDLICTPATAITAFRIGRRPRVIDGQPVDRLWGAFPFAVPFNVAATAAASIPCGCADGLPVGLQLVGPAGADALVLATAEQLENELAFDRSVVLERWDRPPIEPGLVA